MKRIILVTLFILLSDAAYSDPEIKGSPQDLRGFLHPADKIVSISGDAEETAYSDKAIVSMIITTEDKLLSKAIAGNSSLRRQITDSLVASGMAANAINSSKFSSSPQYGWFGSKPSSFKVVNRIAIAITSEEHLKAIATLTDKFEEAELSDTSFEHTKKEAFYERVRTKTLEKILQQKAFYEKSLGVKLIPVGIRDSNIIQGATSGAMTREEAVASAGWSENDSHSSITKYREQAPRPSSFDEIIYRANLTVDFKIDI